MPQLIAILAANPLAGVAGFLVGLSLALCGYLGHTRPIRAGFNAFCVFLLIVLILCLFSSLNGCAWFCRARNCVVA